MKSFGGSVLQPAVNGVINVVAVVVVVVVVDEEDESLWLSRVPHRKQVQITNGTCYVIMLCHSGFVIPHGEFRMRSTTTKLFRVHICRFQSRLDIISSGDNFVF
jgi:hypothetical protein